MLKELDRDIFCAEVEQTLPGRFHLPARMTVVRRPDGALLLHSPIPLDDALAAAIERLGPVKDVVLPSRLHHLYAAPCLQRFPGARLHGAPGLPEKRPDLRFDAILGDDAEAPFQGAFEQELVGGAPSVSETVFFHRPSATLIVTDLVFNVRSPKGFMANLVLWLVGAHGRFAQSRSWRFFIQDRAAARRSAERILAWPFRRVVMAHGEVLEEDAHAAMERALGWLQAKPALREGVAGSLRA